MEEGAKHAALRGAENTIPRGCAVVARVVGHTGGVRTPIAVTAAAAISAIVSCSDEPTRSVDAFCQRLRVEQNLLTARLTDPAQITPLVSRFKALDARAPEQIRDEWHQITLLVEKASATDASSPEAQTQLVERALATDQSVAAVKTYATGTCQVTL